MDVEIGSGDMLVIPEPSTADNPSAGPNFGDSFRDGSLEVTSAFGRDPSEQEFGSRGEESLD